MGKRSTTSPKLVRSTSEIVELNREATSHGLKPIEEFKTGDHVFLKVIPNKFDKQGELWPRYIKPFEIRERVGTVKYRLVLLPR